MKYEIEGKIHGFGPAGLPIYGGAVSWGFTQAFT
jgi:hypothetical protein